MNIGYDVYESYIRAFCSCLKVSFGVEKILAVALFGSVARGQARLDSDIDLLVVHKEVDFNPVHRSVDIALALKEEDEYKHLAGQGLNPQPVCVFMTKTELWDRPHILLDILVEGILLFDVGVLQSRLSALKERLNALGSKRVALPDGTWYWDLKPDWKPGEIIEL
ncbi:MAG: nucleotidyltransferase domain-containing protein [Candidatus Poribacteria bacterium]|nr:nucleotidyltransferase domain-containing protein [Candidatus Poribacteria bacterium]MDE0505077.1 nucleotidyltransferase domain-containing protein [Candidatus Poribacteria bacterium]